MCAALSACFSAPAPTFLLELGYIRGPCIGLLSEYWKPTRKTEEVKPLQWPVLEAASSLSGSVALAWQEPSPRLQLLASQPHLHFSLRFHLRQLQVVQLL